MSERHAAQGGKWKFSKTGVTRCEEAGTELFHQHDGTRSHTVGHFT